MDSCTGSRGLTSRILGTCAPSGAGAPRSRLIRRVESGAAGERDVRHGRAPWVARLLTALSPPGPTGVAVASGFTACRQRARAVGRTVEPFRSGTPDRASYPGSARSSRTATSRTGVAAGGTPVRALRAGDMHRHPPRRAPARHSLRLAVLLRTGPAHRPRGRRGVRSPPLRAGVLHAHPAAPAAAAGAAPRSRRGRRTGGRPRRRRDRRLDHPARRPTRRATRSVRHPRPRGPHGAPVPRRRHRRLGAAPRARRPVDETTRPTAASETLPCCTPSSKPSSPVGLRLSRTRSDSTDSADSGGDVTRKPYPVRIRVPRAAVLHTVDSPPQHPSSKGSGGDTQDTGHGGCTG